MRTLLTILLIGVLLVGAWLAYGLLVPTSPAVQQFVLFRPGSSARQIAALLETRGVIRNRYAFLLMHYATGRKSLKAGEYAFQRSTNAFDVHERLVRGDVYVRTVVVPEGFNMFDIAAAVEAAQLGSRDDFLKLVRSQSSLVADLDPTAISLEGYLFPDTYNFTRTQSLKDIVAAMVKRFHHEASAIGLTADVHRVVTLASIVEKETAVPDERPLVAGVFTNRLAQRIALATDPSVIYAALLAGRYRGAIHQSDLQFDSPYNTYRNPGLPPGPIANPGRDSLLAAMKPAATDYLYFVSDNQGHHRFARTLEEHSANVAAYRKAQEAAR